MKGKKKFFENKKGKQQYKNYKNLDKKTGNNRTDEQEEIFKNKLLKKQYTLHVVKSDGNCLFSSISDQVYGTDKHNEIIREKCMDFIEKNKLFYSQFVEGGEIQMPAYIKSKRKDGVWGDNLEIQALSEIYSRPIEIYIDVDKPIRSFCNDIFKNKYPIKLSYHGNKHYNSIVPSVNHPDFFLYKNALINTSTPGTYETKFIKDYDISKKLNINLENLNEPIQFDDQFNDFDDEDYLYQDIIENSKNEYDKDIGKNEKLDNNFNDMKNDDEYLGNPIIQKALEFGFNLNDAIEAFKVCGEDEELVMNYLCNNQNY